MCVLVSGDFVNEVKNNYVVYVLSRVSCLGIFIHFSMCVVMQTIQVRIETTTPRLAKHFEPTLQGELESNVVVLSNTLLACLYRHGVNTMVMSNMDNCWKAKTN